MKVFAGVLLLFVVVPLWLLGRLFEEDSKS